MRSRRTIGTVFVAYAQRLRTPTIYNAIKEAEQLKIARFGFPASVRRHFDRLEEFPRGLLPFGDAICRFNPVYGQGMSVAAQEARFAPRDPPEAAPTSRTRSRGLAAAFFSEAATLIETPWALAAVPDLAHPKAEGERPEDLEQRLAFSEALNRVAAEDPARSTNCCLKCCTLLSSTKRSSNDPDLASERGEEPR